MSDFRSKTSSIFVTVFIGIIVVSFMFTGYETMRSAPDSVATVGKYSVTFREFQNEYNRQLNFYKNIFGGGKDLTKQQIEQFNIKGQALNNAIQLKLMLLLGDKLSLVASPAEVKTRIKELPYFQTNGAFDINKYKGLLAANGFSPSSFESQIKDESKTNQTRSLITSFPLSKKYMKDLETFKNQSITTTAVSVEKAALKKHVKVTKSEVTKYLADKTKLARVESLFKERQKSLSTPETVTARHILLKTEGKDSAAVLKKANDIRKKLTIGNFKKMANIHTEDPTGKNNGGRLGPFGKGQMVPEFEKAAFSMKIGAISNPIKTNFGYHIIFKEAHTKEKIAKLNNHKSTLAKELIRNDKSAEVEIMLKKISGDLKTAFAKKTGYEKIVNKYSFPIDREIQINRVDGSTGQVSLTAENLKEIFSKGLNQNNVFEFSTAAGKVIVKTAPGKKPETKTDEQIDNEMKALKRALTSKLGTDVLKSIQENAKIQRFPHRIR